MVNFMSIWPGHGSQIFGHTLFWGFVYETNLKLMDFK
jgi:hypothetical protein